MLAAAVLPADLAERQLVDLAPVEQVLQVDIEVEQVLQQARPVAVLVEPDAERPVAVALVDPVVPVVLVVLVDPVAPVVLQGAEAVAQVADPGRGLDVRSVVVAV